MKDSKKIILIVVAAIIFVIVVLAGIILFSKPSVSSIIDEQKQASFISSTKLTIKMIDLITMDGTEVELNKTLDPVDLLGASYEDYSEIEILSLDPIKINLKGKDGGKFSGCEAKNSTEYSVEATCLK